MDIACWRIESRIVLRFYGRELSLAEDEFNLLRDLMNRVASGDPSALSSGYAELRESRLARQANAGIDLLTRLGLTPSSPQPFTRRF